MGNAASTQGGASTTNPAGAGQPSTLNNNGNPSPPLPTGTAGSTSTTGPIVVPRNAGNQISSNTGTPRAGTPAQSSGLPAPSSSTFHSGLTPPTIPPSPPPPSTPLLLPFAGHLSPQNPHALSHPQAHDYSKHVVTKLILDNELAPFYRGLEDFDEDWQEDKIGELLLEVREKDYEEGVGNSVVARMKEEREGSSGGLGVGSVVKKIGILKKHGGAGDNKLAEDKEERMRRENAAYVGATECPICFLNYPSNINTSRCCQQPICTECFVQIHRSEATLTHLESEPACCPFCMETDFGVIYERPNVIPLTTNSSANASNASQSALSVSPDTTPGTGTAGISGISRTLSMNSEEAELSVGPGMAPKAQETMRRKSVSHKAKEVVTIDQTRPDWENKLNAVKAAAARKASRRIVMRQVGDRLIPIGYTSARAPGVADFSMSVPTPQSDENGSRRNRRGTRERDLEELMIMEAMRLSMVDHEEHQKKMHEDAKRGGTSTPPPIILGESSISGSGGINALGSGNRKRSDTGESSKESKTSKFLSKLGGRSRSGSSAKKPDSGNTPLGSASPRMGTGVSTSTNPSTTNLINTSVPTSPTSAVNPSGGGGGGISTSPVSVTASSPLAQMSTTASDNQTQPQSQPQLLPTSGSSKSNIQPNNVGASSSSPISRSPPTSTGLVSLSSPGIGNPIAPITTLANHTSVKPGQTPPIGATTSGLPRLSMDMPALTPDQGPGRKSMDRARESLDLKGKRRSGLGYSQLGDE